jgi:signal transduction histidine kinase
MVDLRAVIISSLVALTASAREAVTNLTDLRKLTAAEASTAIPVRIDGIVVGLEPATRFHFFLHDGGAGCFIKTHPSGRPDKLKPGDHVRVEGFSDPLGFYPSVKDGKVKILGSKPLPPPANPAAGDMFSPQLDSEWVEVPAVITSYEIADDRITLAVEVHGLPFKAELPVTHDAEPRAATLMQRPVRLRGVMGTIFNRQRQMTDRHFFVQSFDEIKLTEHRQNGENLPTLTVSELLTGPYGPTTLVRLQGTITQHDPRGFYLRDSSGSTLIESAKIDQLPPGTQVLTEGFGAVAPFRPFLRATRVTNLKTTATIAPIPFNFKTGDLSDLHAEWVTLDADFLGQRDGPVDGILQFRANGQFFEVLRPHTKNPLPSLHKSGDRIRLTGICELTTTHALPRIEWVDGFRIHLPEHGGAITISHAPWWTTQRLLVALGLMSGVASLGFLGTWLLRRQVKTQMQIISAKLRSEAVGEERDRMARELHDTLEQQLSGVALQLDSLDHAVKQNPASASATLTLARRMLRYTRLEARRSVWDLRSKVLEEEGLSAAIRAISETSGPAGPAIIVTVTGNEHILPTGVDFHLLRIAQEATTNAIKHSVASTIHIEIEYLAHQIQLIIRDDGRGYDPAAAASMPNPHFGLLGMRERAAKIAAQLTISTSPGNGCIVRITLPNKI